jgi:hypothetical protein
MASDDDAGAPIDAPPAIDAAPATDAPGDPPDAPEIPDAGPADAPLACPTDCSELDDPCHDGVCDGATGACVAITATDGTSCDDAMACTTGDVCTAGACAGAPVDCSTLTDACHAGVCEPTSGACVQTTAADGSLCDDGAACTTGDVCTTGVCSGAPVDCSSMTDACHTGACDPATGACGRTTRPDGSTCSDAMACTTGDVCTGGTCSGATVSCPSTMCTTGFCNPTSGACTSTPVPNGTSCTFDTNLCTRDSCTAGTCGATPVCRPPSSLVPFGAYANTALRGLASSPLSTDDCPVGSTLVGVEVRVNTSGYVGSIRGICAPWMVSGSGAGPYTATTGTTTLLPERGTTGTGAYMTTLCPAGQAMVGFAGRAGGAIDQIAARCAPMSIAATPTEWVANVGTGIATSSPVGGTGGIAFPNTDCPAGQVATRLMAHTGGDVHGVSLGCRPPRLTYRVSLAAAGTTAQQGGTGGTAFSDGCPPGSVVFGYDAWVEPSGVIGGIRAACSTIEIVGPVASPAILLRDVASPLLTPVRGSSTGTLTSARCPLGLVVGFAGRSAVLVDQLAFRCATPSASATAVTLGPITTLPPVGGSGGTPFPATDCPAGSFATRNVGRAFAALDAFAMGCSTGTW